MPRFKKRYCGRCKCTERWVYGSGVQGFARMERFAGGIDGRDKYGVMGSQMRGLVDGGGRKERLLGGAGNFR